MSISTKNVVLIPHWITEAVERAGLPPETVLDIRKLSEITSRDDLVCYMTLNNGIERFFGINGIWDTLRSEFWVNLPQNHMGRVKTETNTIPFDTNGVVNQIDYQGQPGQISNPRDEEFEALLNGISGLSFDESFIKKVSARLFDESSKTDRYPTPFIAYDLTREVCGVVVFPGHFIDGQINARAEALIESVLEVFSRSLPENVVYSTPYFKRFLQLLRVHSVIV